MAEFVNTDWVTTVAASSGVAVDDDLGRKSHLWPLVVSQNVDSVSQGTGGTVGPA